MSDGGAVAFAEMSGKFDQVMQKIDTVKDRKLERHFFSAYLDYYNQPCWAYGSNSL